MEKLLKPQIILVVSFICLLSFSSSFASDIATTKPVRALSQDDITLLPGSGNTSALYDERKDIYAKGFNAALECVALVNLEAKIECERKTFRELFEICRKRNTR